MMSYGDDYDDTRARGVPARTRTRLPDQPETATRRPAASPFRGIGAIVCVVVLLLAAIVFANQNREDRADDGAGGRTGGGEPGRADATAPSGERPVDRSFNGIPTGFAQDAQGAQSAAANYAVALGGTEMFNPDQRRTVVETVSTAANRDDLVASYDRAYSPALNERIGLGEDGTVPDGYTFVNRTLPVGSTTTEYSDTAAEVSVWCAGLFGIAGTDSRTPVRTSWFTLHFTLAWEDGDWKVVRTEQTAGPTPVAGDDVVSGAEEIAEAAELYGGFTYAR